MPELPMDPDLEQVLVDLEADPRAGLYLAEPRKLIRGLRDGSLMVRPSRTGLSSAQRELVEVHRHELAWLLREAWLREFFDGRRSLPVTRRFSVSSRADLQKRWNADRDTMPDAIRVRPEVGVLRAFLQPMGEPSLPSNTALIWASLMVQDAPHARVFLGMDHLTSENVRAALAILGEVAGGPFRQLLRAQAKSLAAVAFLALDRPEKALSFYTDAYELTRNDQLESRPLEHLLNVLAAALVLKEEKHLIWASERIRERSVPNKTFVAELARRVWARGTPNEFVLGKDMRVFAVRMADKLDSTSWEFIHALV